MRKTPGFGNEWKTIGVWSVMAVALVVRLIWIRYVHPVPASDFLWYKNEAISLLHGDGYQYDGRPTAYFPMGYPLFLSLIYRWFGVSWLSGVVANVVLNVLTVGLVYAAAFRQFGRVVAWVSGLFMALYLPHVEWSSVLCSEMLFTCLFFLSYYIYLIQVDGRRPWIGLILSGIALGLACVVRPVALLSPGAFLLFSLIHGAGLRRSVLGVLVVTAAMFMAISPVTIRNYIAFHRLILVSTNGGVNLWQGNNPDANGEYFWPNNPKENPFLQYEANELIDDKLASRMAWDYIESHPGITFQRALTKWYNLFKGVDNANHWSVGHASPPVTKAFQQNAYILSLVEYRGVLAAAVLGIVLQLVHAVRRRDTLPLLGILVAAYYVSLFAIFPAWDRMRAPVEPWLVLFAAFALCKLFSAGWRSLWR